MIADWITLYQRPNDIEVKKVQNKIIQHLVILKQMKFYTYL